MKGATSAIKVGLTALFIFGLGYIAFRFVAKGLGGDEGYQVFALFNDATGLVDKSRVQIAGLHVGEIRGRRLAGSKARVDLRLRPDVEVWSNAAIYKKSASLIGEFYLEIDPGTPTTPDPVSGQQKPNYLLRGCEQTTKKPDCNRIVNVIEAVTATDIMVQINETLPVMRDILLNVRRMTEGPVQDVLKQVQSDIERNAKQLERLLGHIDEILDDIGGFTHGKASEDLRVSVENVRDITEGIKGLVGKGEGEMSSTGDKIRRDLDKLSVTLEKLNTSLEKVNKVGDDVATVTDRVARGEGTVGRLLKDDAIAENVTQLTEDTAVFVRSLTRLQTIVGLRSEYNVMTSQFKTYLSLKLQPRPNKWYLLELVDDPRGSRSYSHQLQVVTGGDLIKQGAINTDTWTRSSAFRFSFMFARRYEAWGRLGITGRVGIKESTGGVGLDLDLWRERFVLSIDLFDFLASSLPRLKIWAALELLTHIWLVAGADDLLNGQGAGLAPNTDGKTLITCGPATPGSWCQGGRDYFFGAMLTFNDEDLRALLTIGAGALGTGASSQPR